MVRCNADVQWQGRGIPEDAISASEHSATSPGLIKGLLYGARHVSNLMVCIIVVLATVIRSSHIADFYMTKYQSKAQQALSSALGPLITGLRRQEEKETTADDAKSVQDKAFSRIRRLIFSANRCQWFSACECSLYVRTGATEVRSFADALLFASKPIYMLHEAKRDLNGMDGAIGLTDVDRLKKDVENCQCHDKCRNLYCSC